MFGGQQFSAVNKCSGVKHFLQSTFFGGKILGVTNVGGAGMECALWKSEDPLWRILLFCQPMPMMEYTPENPGNYC